MRLQSELSPPSSEARLGMEDPLPRSLMGLLAGGLSPRNVALSVERIMTRHLTDPCQ